MKTEKPKLFGKFKIALNIVVSLILSLFGLLKLPENFDNTKILVTLLIISIISFISIFIICNIVYSIRMYFYCRNLERNIKGLIDERKNLNIELKRRNEIIQNLKDYNRGILAVVDDLVNHLETGILTKTKAEQKYLIKLHEIVCNKYNSIRKGGKDA